MEKKRTRSKDTRSRNARAFNRQNQSIFGRVASNISSWISNLWVTNSPDEVEEETSQQPTPHGSKRPRLNLNQNHSTPLNSLVTGESHSVTDNDDRHLSTEHNSKRPRLALHNNTSSASNSVARNAISSDSTLSPIFGLRPATSGDSTNVSSMFGSRPMVGEDNIHVPPRTFSPKLAARSSQTPPVLFSSGPDLYANLGVQSPLLNGEDDNSENSEGSASTSGISSIVSSQEKFNSSRRLNDGGIASFRRNFHLRNMRNVSLQNEYPGSSHSNRSALWSSPYNSSPGMSKRPSSVGNVTSPGLNSSSYLRQTTKEPKMSSPFYAGNTTFGGASSVRRMPSNVAPYQVDKTDRVKIKSKPQPDEDLALMSCAARRILQTLEKMSTPVTDAKKIPNTNKSPVDLSLYLMPPRKRINLQSPHTSTTKGPPIADISTISKLTTIKRTAPRRILNSYMIPPVLPVSSSSSVSAAVIKDTPAIPDPQTSPPERSGGKMRCRLNQQHRANKKTEDEESFVPKKILPAPISEIKLPRLSFAQLDKKSIPVAKFPPIEKPSDGFVFSDTSVKRPSKSEKLPSPKFGFDRVDDPSKTVAKFSNVEKSPDIFFFSEPSGKSPVKTDSPTSFIPFSFSEPICHTLPSSSDSSDEDDDIQVIPFTPQLPKVALPLKNSTVSSTWKCDSCWLMNPNDKRKCMACETPRQAASILNINAPSALQITKTDSFNFPSASAPTSLPSTTLSGTSFTLSASTPLANKVSSSKPSQTSSWTCKECWITNPQSKDKCAACETPNPTPQLKVSSVVRLSDPKTSNSWVCDTCSQRNDSDGPRCLSCEALRPGKGNTPTFTGKEGFKLYSPQQGSAITFKFGSHTLNSQTGNIPVIDLDSEGEESAPSIFGSVAKSFSASKEAKDPASEVGTLKPSPPKAKSSIHGSELASKLSKMDDPLKMLQQLQSKAKEMAEVKSPPKIDIVAPLSTTAIGGVSVPAIAKNDSVVTDPASSTVAPTPVFKFGSQPTDNTISTAPVFKFGSSTTSSAFVTLPAVSSSESSTNVKLNETNSEQKDEDKLGNAQTNVFGALSATQPESKSSSIFSIATKSENKQGATTFGSSSLLATKTEAETTSTSSGFEFKPNAPVFGSAGAFSTPATSLAPSTTSSLSTDLQTSAPVFQFGSGAQTVTTSAPTFGSPFTFGAKTEPLATNPLLTTNSTTSSVFGNFTSTANTSAFGKPETSNSSVFGKPIASSTSVFGKPDASNASTFGKTDAPNTSVFGKPDAMSASVFGKPDAMSTSVFGKPDAVSTSVFGKPNVFGKQNTENPSVFGTANTVGSSSMGVFGATNEAAATTNIGFGTGNTAFASTGSVFGKINPPVSAAPAGFTFGATTMVKKPDASTAPASGFNFKMPSMPTTSAPSFGAFGSTPSTTTFSGFQAAPSSTPAFKFGGQSPANNAPAFGASAASGVFKFGAKNEPMANAAPAPMYPGAQSTISAPVQQPTAGFNFGLAAAPAAAPVFRFGATEQAAPAPAFAFGGAQQETAAPAPAFNFSTPQNFNFGAAQATPSQPFQFSVGSTDSSSQQRSDRRIKKAVRRVRQ